MAMFFVIAYGISECLNRMKGATIDMSLAKVLRFVVLGVAVGELGKRPRDGFNQVKESWMDFGPQADDVFHGSFVYGCGHFLGVKRRDAKTPYP
jgi:hypothetical protein